MLLNNDSKVDISLILDNAYGDADGGKVNERVPPLFMLPLMYNGYTNYTCPILEDNEYEEGSDTSDEYLKKLGLEYLSTKSPSDRDKSDSQRTRLTHPKKSPNAANSKSNRSN